MPTHLPDISLVRQAYDLYNSGVTSWQKIAEKIGVDRQRVARWINDPDRFSPWIDEVAIERALEGDRTVYRNLSGYEMEEFWLQAARISETTELEYELTDTGAFGYNPRIRYLADCLGMTTNAVSRAQTKARMAQRAGA